MDYGTLSYAQRGGAVQRFGLQLGNIGLGRAAENDLVLDADEVDPKHVQLTCSADGCTVTDLGSSGGTFLNLVRIQANVKHPLRDGDILRIGPFFVRYAEATQTAAPGEGQAGEAAPTARPASLAAPQQVIPPEVAARLPRPAVQRAASLAKPGARRLRGNINSGGPPRIPAGRRRLADGASSYLQYLPPIYQNNDFMGRFLLIFESILSPIERSVDQIHHYFDPRLTPEALLPWLASWVDLVLNENWPAERRRELIRSASNLYRWRGTRRGLSEYIRIYTGFTPTIIEPSSDGPGADLPPHVFRVVLDVPDPDLFDQELVEAIIEAEKPAHTAYILDVRQRAAR